MPDSSAIKTLIQNPLSSKYNWFPERDNSFDPNVNVTLGREGPFLQSIKPIPSGLTIAPKKLLIELASAGGSKIYI